MKSNGSGKSNLSGKGSSVIPGSSAGSSVGNPIKVNRSSGHSLQHANYDKLTGSPSTKLSGNGMSKGSDKSVG